MTLDKSARDAIGRTVARLRALFEEEFRQQARGRFGFHMEAREPLGGDCLPVALERHVESLTALSLTPRELYQRSELVGVLEYLVDKAALLVVLGAPLTLEGNNYRPFWSPDGTEVGFITSDGAVHSRAADSSGEIRILRAESDTPIMEALWTPDGQWLVYRDGNQDEGQDSNLYYAAPHPDSTAVAILDTPFLEYSPSLSPVGRWLAYTSNESGRAQVYVRPFPGPGGRSPVSLSGGRSPVWAHSGGEIFYLAADNSWVVATVRTDTDFVVESRAQFASAEGFWFPGVSRHFDVALDDQRLLAIQYEGDQASANDRYVVVQNFFEELKERVPN